MKEKLEQLKAALADAATKEKLLGAADTHKSYHGKVVLGKSFTVTRGGLVATAFVCGETAMHKFFDGEDLVVENKKVSEWMAECEKFEVKESK